MQGVSFGGFAGSDDDAVVIFGVQVDERYESAALVGSDGAGLGDGGDFEACWQKNGVPETVQSAVEDEASVVGGVGGVF